ANLLPSATTHVSLLRQNDGSYTAFELTNSSPYRIIRTTPNFQKQLGSCPGLPAAGATLGSQPPEAMARLSNGGYLSVRRADLNGRGKGGIGAVTFDGNLHVVAEAQYSVTLAQTIAITDLNGDGNPDIVIGAASRQNCAIVVLLGAGGANFQPPATYDISSSL